MNFEEMSREELLEMFERLSRGDLAGDENPRSGAQEQEHGGEKKEDEARDRGNGDESDDRHNDRRVADAAERERDRDHLIESLRIHQVELEMQNRELRESHALLEESRNRYADLYDFAPIAYFTFDDQGRIQEVNLTGTSLLGRDRAKVLGLPFLALVQMPEPAQLWRHLRRCAGEGGSVVSELTFSVPHGGEIHVEAASVPVLDAAGRAVGYRTAFTDISGRTKAQAERQRAFNSERVLRNRSEAMDRAGVAISNALASLSEANRNVVLRVIVEQSRIFADAGQAALGVGDPEFDEPFEQLFVSGASPASPEPVEARAPSASRASSVPTGSRPRPPAAVGLLAEVSHSGRVVRIGLDGAPPELSSWLPAHLRVRSFLGVPIRYGDRQLGCLFLTNKRGADEFSEDDEEGLKMLAERAGLAMETARITLDNARLYKEASEAVHARDNLLAVVSHDLRSPLNVIRLSAGLISGDRLVRENQGVRKPAELIERAVRQMNHMIESLLRAAIIEAGRFTVEPHPQDAASIMDECVQLSEPIAASKSIHIERAAKELPPVRCDRERVLEVFSNLVENALKFTPHGGTVRLAAATHDGEVRFSVSDNGCGIAREDLPRLFDRYWKGRTGARRGSGLGLYIANGIVEAHGGKMWAESELEIGSTFYFTLPIAT